MHFRLVSAYLRNGITIADDVQYFVMAPKTQEHLQDLLVSETERKPGPVAKPFGGIPIYTDCRLPLNFVGVNEFSRGLHTCLSKTRCTAWKLERQNDIGFQVG